MYSGEKSDDDDDHHHHDEKRSRDDVSSSSTTTKSSGDTDVLARLAALRLECGHLRDQLNDVLRSSSLCRKYTTSSQDLELQKPHSQGRQRSKSAVAHGKHNRKVSASPFSTRRRRVSFKGVLSHDFLEKQRREVKKYNKRRKELLERRFSQPLEPFVVYQVLSHTATRSERKVERHQIATIEQDRPRGPTVPEPFQFTIREETTPIRATYALRFLDQLLAERKSREIVAQNDPAKKFQAHSVPPTTYHPDTKHFIGQITRKPKPVTAMVPLKNRSFSEPNINETTSQRTPFRANPVPLTTYIPPKREFDLLKERAHSQRTMDLLLQSRLPFGYSDHSVRSNVQYRVRHGSRCFGEPATFQPSIAKSVPDFRQLHREFENRMFSYRRRNPGTMPVPFRFHTSNLTKHHCDNMDALPRFKTAESKGPKRAKSALSKRSASAGGYNSDFES